MTSRKGSQKKGPPAHQNKVAWVPNRAVKKNETEPGSRSRPLSTISAVCTRCRDQIAWKRKYGKYKMLLEPAKCASCQRRNVKDSYHALCRECASAQKVCAKCRRPSGNILPDESENEAAERTKLEHALRNMRERDRRTLLRELEKPSANRGELIANAKLKDDDDDDDSDGDDSLGTSGGEEDGGEVKEVESEDEDGE